HNPLQRYFLLLIRIITFLRVQTAMRAARLRMRDAKPHGMHSRDRRNYVSGVCARPPVKSRNDDETRWQSWWHADTRTSKPPAARCGLPADSGAPAQGDSREGNRKACSRSADGTCCAGCLGSLRQGLPAAREYDPVQETVPAGSARVQDAHAQAGAGKAAGAG